MASRIVGLAVLLGLLTLAPPARAQGLGGFDDPFTLYYGFFLPRQAALAATPRPEQTVNAMASIRQERIANERAGLYDPIIPPWANNNDPADIQGNRRAGKRPGGVAFNSGVGSNLGPGVSKYYGRTPTGYKQLPSGRSRGANASLAVGSRRGGGGGARGMVPSPSSGMGGMR